MGNERLDKLIDVAHELGAAKTWLDEALESLKRGDYKLVSHLLRRVTLRASRTISALEGSGACGKKSGG
jgi:hypothetical protein